MFYLIAILSLVATGLLLALFHRNDDTPAVVGRGDCSACTGQPSDKCEQVCMMEAAVRETEYYNDEELDCYKGRPSDGYTDAEAEEFREVMLTMRQEEVRPWGRSLNLRGISLPNQVKDDFALLVSP